MGIRFACPHCGCVLNVKDHLAGKRGICPDCQARLEIPLTSVLTGSTRAPFVPGASVALKEPVPGDSIAGSAPPSAAPAPRPPSAENGAAVDPIAEAPQLQWYVQPQGSTSRYGPAVGDTMRSWMRAGRVAPDAMIWREGWPHWRIAHSVFPQLAEVAPAEPAAQAPAAATKSATDVVVLGEPVADAEVVAGEGAVVVDLTLADITGDAPIAAKRGPARVRPVGRGIGRSQRTTIVALLVVATLALLIVLVWVVMR